MKSETIFKSALEAMETLSSWLWQVEENHRTKRYDIHVPAWDEDRRMTDAEYTEWSIENDTVHAVEALNSAVVDCMDTINSFMEENEYIIREN